MDNADRNYESRKSYRSTFLQVFGLLIGLWFLITQVMANPVDDEPVPPDYLTTYLFISSICVFYMCHLVALRFSHHEKFEEYSKMNSLSREEYLKLRNFLDYLG